MTGRENRHTHTGRKESTTGVRVLVMENPCVCVCWLHLLSSFCAN